MNISNWLHDNYIEIFGALAGIIYVVLEIRQNLWLWPVGIITSAVYIWVFFTGKLYADMSLQGYYLVISVMGWYWWVRGSGLRAQGSGQEIVTKSRLEGRQEGEREGLAVSRVKCRTGVALALMFVLIFTLVWQVLDRFTDSQIGRAHV